MVWLNTLFAEYPAIDIDLVLSYTDGLRNGAVDRVAAAVEEHVAG